MYVCILRATVNFNCVFNFFFFFFMYESQNTPLLIYVLKAFINVIYCLMAFVWCFFHPMKMRNRFDFFMESFFVFF